MNFADMLYVISLKYNQLFHFITMVRTPTSTVTQHKKKSGVQNKNFKQLLAFIRITVATAVTIAASDAPSPPQPKRTSIFTGQCWINELVTGHPDRFHKQMGMRKHIFRRLLNELQLHHGLRDSKHVTAEEQLAIFLYFARTGLPSCMIQERFQRSGHTIHISVKFYFSENVAVLTPFSVMCLD
jgi:hypothetical protein